MKARGDGRKARGMAFVMYSKCVKSAVVGQLEGLSGRAKHAGFTTCFFVKY